MRAQFCNARAGGHHSLQARCSNALPHAIHAAGSTTTAVEPLISSRDGDSMAPGLVAAAKHAGKLVLCIQGFHPEASLRLLLHDCRQPGLIRSSVLLNGAGNSVHAWLHD